MPLFMPLVNLIKMEKYHMKRAFCLALCVLFVFSFMGCDDNKPSSSSTKKFEPPTAASPPDSMTVDEILYIVNELLGYEDESKKTFIKEAADVFRVPAPPDKTEVLYLFMIGDLEIGLFASSEKDCVINAYVRMLFDYPVLEAQMMSFAGVFLAALEPNGYEKMIVSVMPAGEEEAMAMEESKSASGEFWRIRYAKSLTNIMPKEGISEEPADSPASTSPIGNAE